MAAPVGDYFEIASVRTFVVQKGEGAPVILLHGLGASSYSWRHLVPELSKKNKVYACDIPGFGRSDKPADFDYSFVGFVNWLIAFMDHFKIPKASLVGNSMGGVISLRTVLEFPERVERIALLGTPVYPHNHPALLWPLRWPIIGNLLEASMGPWCVKLVAPTAFYNKECVTPELLAEYGLSLGTREGCRAVASFMRKIIPPDAPRWISMYPQMKHPALVVHGEHDCIVDRPSVDRFLGAVPNGKLLSIPACGHAAQEEKPEVVVPALLEFLSA